ncbi:Histo-blood group ABO system transferase 1 [Triplophysa tibetana]|uniref:Histo-blood group ABO system transferase 1 n=1 Tax=Triplophysa tibetana TaxID=1572043 RepID=A0A5A9P7C9_9TELE|nr:Histo-blood group ABO system transferase 1 [Triplophysa tibetana]
MGYTSTWEKYTQFLKKFLESAEQQYFVGFCVRYYIFTDKPEEIPVVKLGNERYLTVKNVKHESRKRGGQMAPQFRNGLGNLQVDRVENKVVCLALKAHLKHCRGSFKKRTAPKSSVISPLKTPGPTGTGRVHGVALWLELLPIWPYRRASFARRNRTIAEIVIQKLRSRLAVFLREPANISSATRAVTSMAKAQISGPVSGVSDLGVSATVHPPAKRSGAGRTPTRSFECSPTGGGTPLHPGRGPRREGPLLVSNLPGSGPDETTPGKTTSGPTVTAPSLTGRYGTQPASFPKPGPYQGLAPTCSKRELFPPGVLSSRSHIPPDCARRTDLTPLRGVRPHTFDSCHHSRSDSACRCAARQAKTWSQPSLRGSPGDIRLAPSADEPPSVGMLFELLSDGRLEELN